MSLSLCSLLKGQPKGVMITHGNLMCASAALMSRLPKEIETDHEVLLSYLPLAHIYERILETTLIGRGHMIGFYQGVRTHTDICRYIHAYAYYIRTYIYTHFLFHIFMRGI